jgi:hypothetical protein
MYLRCLFNFDVAVGHYSANGLRSVIPIACAFGHSGCVPVRSGLTARTLVAYDSPVDSSYDTTATGRAALALPAKCAGDGTHWLHSSFELSGRPIA